MSSITTTDDIIVERAVRDFEDGLAHTRAGIREKHGLIASTALDAIIMSAVTALHLRARMREDAQNLVAIAHRVAAGEDPHKLAEEHVDHVLRLKTKMSLIAREDDPAFQQIRALALELFARRLPDLARMVSVQAPASFDDLVRKAFPERAYVDAMVDDNARSVEAIIAHLESHPNVLRVPQSMAPKIAHMARDMIEWKVSEVRKGVNEIYAKSS